MPELRKDPVIGRWVIINADRSRRPFSTEVTITEPNSEPCPFCPNNESQTPSEVYALRPEDSQPNGPGWQLRVTSNKYPALKIEGDINQEQNGVYDRMTGIGAHEVIIETSEHDLDMARMSQEQISLVIGAYRERMIDLQKDKRFKYILVFKNHGAAAGASQSHSHSQLIATPIIPKRVAEEVDGARNYFGFRGRCIYCDIIRQEVREKTRLIGQTKNFLSIAPYAARFPFESWIVPKEHQSSFLDLSEEGGSELASCLKDTLQRIRTALDDPPYNFMLHTRPIDPESKKYFHWHIEIIPKLTQVAGFEWGSGFFINHMPPEEASGILRAIDSGTTNESGQ